MKMLEKETEINKKKDEFESKIDGLVKIHK